MKHLDIIKKRYSNSKRTSFNYSLREVMLSYKIFDEKEIKNKIVLEVGGGYSSFTNLFINYKAKKVYVNELIPERFNRHLENEPKVVKIIGNILEVDFEEKVDVVFMKLTWMFLVPYEKELINKLNSILNDNGLIILFEPNYISPISIFKRFTDFKKANPARVFNPIRLINEFKKKGIKTYKKAGMVGLYRVPFILGTNFWYLGKKEIK